MSQSLVLNYMHFIWSTKHRTPWIAPDVQARLHPYLAGICANLDSPAIIVGGVTDHVHLLVDFSKNMAVKEFTNRIKASSSKWWNEEAVGSRAFRWQRGYCGLSVSYNHVTALKEYIANQEAHHRKESYQDEVRRILTKHKIAFDERYLWD